VELVDAELFVQRELAGEIARLIEREFETDWAALTVLQTEKVQALRLGDPVAAV